VAAQCQKSWVQKTLLNVASPFSGKDKTCKEVKKYGIYSLDGYWTIRRQTNSWSVKSQTGQLAKIFNGKFGLSNCSELVHSKIQSTSSNSVILKHLPFTS